jgi:hypothetical protein
MGYENQAGLPGASNVCSTKPGGNGAGQPLNSPRHRKHNWIFNSWMAQQAKLGVHKGKIFFLLYLEATLKLFLNENIPERTGMMPSVCSSCK